jgi:rhodanese-related sulfurtransferase
MKKPRSIFPQPGAWIFTATLMISGSCISQEKLDWTSLKKQIRMQFPTVEHVSPQELSTWLSSSDSTKPILLDVREPDEFSVSHLRNAKLASSEKQAVDIIQALDTQQPVVVYCSVGYRSSKLAAKLQARGFQSVYNLEGSIFEWANQGYPLYRKGSKVNQVHPYNNRWGQLLKSELWFKAKENAK